jgi:hypothetical protein
VNGALKNFIKEKMLGNEYAMNNQSEDENNYSSQMDSRMGLNKGESFRTRDFDQSQNSNL